MFRKPKRPAQHRQRLTNEEGSTSDDEEGIPAKRLEDIRELQKCRERRHGFTAVECAVGKEAAADFEVGGNDPFHQAGGGMLELSEGRRAQRQAAGIEADIREQFKKETLLRDMDEELRKFIESGLKGDGGLREIATKEEEPSVANMDVNQIALHRAAAKVKDYKSGAATELLSNQMLAGIPEVDLGIGSRIVNILETEKKKSELLDISKQKKVVNEKQLLEVGRRQPLEMPRKRRPRPE